MKNHSRNLLRSFILAFAITICLNSCQDDEQIPDTDNQLNIIERIDAQNALDEILSSSFSQRGSEGIADNIDFSVNAIKILQMKIIRSIPFRS